MRQFIGLAIAFCFLPLLLKYFPKLTKMKLELGPALLFTGALIALLGGLSMSQLLGALTKVFTTPSTVKTMVIVVEIGVLGAIMKKYGILEKIVGALEQLIPSKKVLIMLLPAIMGLLPVAGGAYLSIPFVDSLGTDLGMSAPRKASVNLYFRHFSMFVLPYNTTLLMMGTMIPGLNIYTLIGLNLGFVAVLLIGSYFMYVASAPNVKAERSGNAKDIRRAVIDAIVYLSPVYMVLVFNALFGLEMYISVFCCILLTFFLIGKDKSQYVQTAVKGISISNVIMLSGVYFLQNIIQQLDAVIGSVSTIFQGDSIMGILIIVPIVAVTFGIVTGLSMVPLGILLPLVALLPVSIMAKTVYAFYILCCSFLGYYYSPFHLCQLLSCKYVGCSNSEIYKDHLRMLPILMAGALTLFLAYNMILI